MLKRLIACLVLVVTLLGLTGCTLKPTVELGENAILVYKDDNDTAIVSDTGKRCIIFFTFEDTATVWRIILKNKLHKQYEVIATIKVFHVEITIMVRK